MQMNSSLRILNVMITLNLQIYIYIFFIYYYEFFKQSGMGGLIIYTMDQNSIINSYISQAKHHFIHMQFNPIIHTSFPNKFTQ